MKALLRLYYSSIKALSRHSARFLSEYIYIYCSKLSKLCIITTLHLFFSFSLVRFSYQNIDLQALMFMHIFTCEDKNH
jgi:hypothetical protein